MRHLILFVALILSNMIGALAAQTPARPILVLGDSLSAAHNIPMESGWVALMQRRLNQQPAKLQRSIVNASISGETTAGGLARLPPLLSANKPALVLVELGANDGLRGLQVAEIRSNLNRIVKACRDADAKVILLGIELPINYGTPYRDAMRAMYRDIAAEFNVPLVPFLLAGVATDPKLMQDDGLHPLAAGEPQVLKNVWPSVLTLLNKLK